jgi:hypothetical protein
VLTVSLCYSNEPSITKDTLVPTPLNALRNSLRFRDSCLVMKQELDTTRAKLSVVESVLEKSNVIIAKQDSLDVVNRRIILNQDEQLRKVGLQVTVLGAANTGLKMKIRQKNWLLGIAGTVIIALTTVIIKK